MTFTKDTFETKVSETHEKTIDQSFCMSTLLSNMHILYSHKMICIHVVNSNLYK
jgi:hypothetical protein